VFALQNATTTSTVTISNLSGSLQLLGSHSQCTTDRLTAQLTGSLGLSVSVAGEGTVGAEAIFAATQFDIDVAWFDSECAPIDYDMTVDGGMSFTASQSNFAVEYSNYRLGVQVGSEVTQVAVDGAMSSPCFGATVTVASTRSLSITAEAECPSDGSIRVGTLGTEHSVGFAAGQVAIDLGNNGSTDETYPTCRAPQLYQCPS